MHKLTILRKTTPFVRFVALCPRRSAFPRFGAGISLFHIYKKSAKKLHNYPFASLTSVFLSAIMNAIQYKPLTRR